MGGVVAITMTHHVEPVAESGATSIVVTCQRVVEPRRIYRRKWSRVVAITAACRVESVAGSGGATQNPSQEVEQSRGHYYGLPGSGEAVRNPSQRVEQSCGHYCGLPGNPNPSAEARLRCLTERGS